MMINAKPIVWWNTFQYFRIFASGLGLKIPDKTCTCYVSSVRWCSCTIFVLKVFTTFLTSWVIESLQGHATYYEQTKANMKQKGTQVFWSYYVLDIVRKVPYFSL